MKSKNNLIVCWCGSGKPFRDCHYGLKGQKILPFAAICNKYYKNTKKEFCIHPEADPEMCNEIINAHTLQRSRILKEIINSKNEVLTFNPPQYDENHMLKLRSIGWKKASTFRAFCKYHDDKTFEMLEKKDFISTAEQLFLLAYRALCYELYSKIINLNGIDDDLLCMLGHGKSYNENLVCKMLSEKQKLGLTKAINDIENVKSDFDISLLSKEYSDYMAYEICLVGEIAIISTGVNTPTRLLSGQKIQILHNLDNQIEMVQFGVDVSKNKYHVFFYFRKKDNCILTFMKDINKLQDDKLSEFLVQFFFLFSQNTYFSECWWENLTSLQKEHLYELASNSNPYYYLNDYIFDLKLSPWKVVSREFRKF